MIILSQDNFFRLVSAALLLVASDALVHCSPCRADIVARWAFDETGGNIAHPSVGPWDGTLNGGAMFAPGAGVSGGAIQLDQATNSFVNMGKILSLTRTDFSIQAWVKTNPGDPSDLWAVSTHLSGDWDGYVLYVNGINDSDRLNTKAGFYHSSYFILGSGDYRVHSDTTVNDGTWHQIVGVYHLGGNAQIYVDGGMYEDQKPARVIGEPNGLFLVGGLTDRFSFMPIASYTGMIDEVQVYDHALSPAEVDFLFSHPGQAVPEPASLLLLSIAGLLSLVAAFRKRLSFRFRSAARAVPSVLLAFAVGSCLPAQSAQADLTSGLLGYWPFDGNGSDLAPGQRHLDLVGNPGFANGLFGQALDLHRNQSQYAVRPIDDPELNFGSSDFTVQIWANLNTVTPIQNLLEKFQAQSGPGWTLVLAGGSPIKEPHFYALGGGINLYGGQLPDVQPDAWQQFIGRRQGTTFDLIHNGAIVGTDIDDRPLTSTTFPLIIGRRNTDDPRDFSVDGRLDEAAIWNRALSNEEIAYLYNGGLGNPVGVPEPATLALAVIGAISCGFVLRRRWRRLSQSVS